MDGPPRARSHACAPPGWSSAAASRAADAHRFGDARADIARLNERHQPRFEPVRTMRGRFLEADARVLELADERGVPDEREMSTISAPRAHRADADEARPQDVARRAAVGTERKMMGPWTRIWIRDSLGIRASDSLGIRASGFARDSGLGIRSDSGFRFPEVSGELNSHHRGHRGHGGRILFETGWVWTSVSSVSTVVARSTPWLPRPHRGARIRTAATRGRPLIRQTVDAAAVAAMAKRGPAVTMS